MVEEPKPLKFQLIAVGLLQITTLLTPVHPVKASEATDATVFERYTYLRAEQSTNALLPT